jgi:hypothetical protein
MYPVCLRARGDEHWFAWRHAEDPDDAIARDADGVLWSSTLPGLVAAWRTRHPGIDIDSDVTVVDLDALIAGLRSTDAADFEALLLALNMLDDIGHACRAAGQPAAFGTIRSRLELYDVVFSQTGAGEIVDVLVQSMTDADRRTLADWLQTGVEMVRAVTAHRLH